MSVTESTPQLAEKLSGFFYDAFRVVGVSMVSTSAMEKLRTVGERMAKTLEFVAERKAIQVAQKLQVAVIDGFNQVEEKLLKHKQAKQAMMDLIKNQTEQIQELRMRIESLEAVSREAEEYPEGPA